METKKRITANLIAEAKSCGSHARTAKGAFRYIMENRNLYPLTQRGDRLGRWNKKEEYFANLLIEKDERYLNSIGKMSKRQIIARNARRDSNMIGKALSFLQGSWPYRQSESHWAGGEHFITVKISEKPFACGESQQVWSSNGKWSGNNSCCDIHATRRTFKYFPRLITPDGLAVVDARKVSAREFEIVWVEQSRGFDLKTVAGWLIKGFHVKGGTLANARKKAVVSRKKAIAAEMAMRQRYVDFQAVWVSFQDSIDAGNCKATSKQVENQLKRKFGKIGGIRADELLIHRDDFYSRRAIAIARLRKA